MSEVHLDADFERKAREAIMDDVEHRLIGQQANLVHQFVQRAHEVLRAYGDRHGYDVEPIIDTLEDPEVERSGGRITVRVGWSHEAAPFMQMGTSDHTIDGDPVLSFVWEDPPQWVTDEFEAEGDGYRVFFGTVEVEGLPASRFVRRALEWLRQEVS